MTKGGTLLFTFRRYLLVAVTCLFMAANSFGAASPDCVHHRCGLLANGTYRNLVIGRVLHVGSAADMTRVYHWAKAHGYWKSLPNTLSPYLHDVRLVTLALPHSVSKRPVTVFMQIEEYAAAPLSIGSLVRYSPHGVHHDVPAKADAEELALYHGLTGCVAVLCRKHDAACFKRYRQGVFTKAHGQPVSLRSGKPIPGGAAINPVSLFPRKSPKTR